MAEDDILTKRRGGGGARPAAPRRARAAQRKAERATNPPEPRPARARAAIVCADRDPIDCVREWFASEGRSPFEFQEEVWQAYLNRESGLIHAATGTGKTYAAWLGPIMEWLRDYPAAPLPLRSAQGRLRRQAAPPLRVLWIT